MIGVLLALAAMVILRDLLGSGVVEGTALISILIVVGVVIAVELGTLAAAGRADREGRLVRTRVWYGSMVVEALAPTAIILIMQLTTPLGLVEGLSAPTILLYGMVCALAILRLRPLLCVLAGSIGAVGHAVLTAFAWATSATLAEGGAAVQSEIGLFHFSYAFSIALFGVVCALAAGEVRRWVQSTLREQAERRRVEMIARNTLIFGLAKIAEYRDSDTGAHLDRISAYCELLCGPLQSRFPEIDAAWIERLRLASSMHDIGKVGIPDAVLLKPGRLDPEERHIIERHPDLGYRALDSILRKHGGDKLLEMSADIAACHHERWDGKGYPNGLAGSRIPLAARIVSVADVYDALTSARVYKPAMPHEKAAALIREGSGTQFDPEVVAAFDRVEELFNEVRAQHAPAPEGEPAAGT